MNAESNLVLNMLDHVVGGEVAQVKWLEPEQCFLDKAHSEDSNKICAFPVMQAEVLVGDCSIMVKNAFAFKVQLRENNEVESGVFSSLDNTRWKSAIEDGDTYLEELLSTIAELQPDALLPKLEDFGLQALNSEISRYHFT